MGGVAMNADDYFGGQSGYANEREDPALRRPAVVDSLATNDERTWATFIHLGGLSWLLIPVGGGLLVPLVLWLIKRKDSPFLDDHGRETVNFQISILIYWAIAGILTAMCFGVILLPIVGLLSLVAPIVCAVRANRGEYVRYPATIRFLQ